MGHCTELGWPLTESGIIVYIFLKAGKPAGSGKAATGAAGGGTDDDAMPTVRTRPEVTQKGVAMIGDLRTDALHQALADTPIEDETLLGLLILAFGGDNVTVDSGSDLRGDDRQAICHTIIEGGVLTADLDLLRHAARRMLIGVLSCRENRSQSGAFARVAGEAIGASLRLPNMATEAFLSCLSRGALETAARTEGVRVEPRAKDTRARMITRFKDGPFVYPGALFRLTPEELEAAAERRHARSGAGWVGPATGEDGKGGGDGDAEPEAGDEDDAGFEREAA